MEHESFRRLVGLVSGELASAEHRDDASFIKTPLLYPGGSSVVVRIDKGVDEFFVSDVGLGFQEAEMLGGSRIYSLHARRVADANGIGFDSHAFFVAKAAKDRLAGVVTIIANCSQQAAMLVAQKISQERTADAAEDLIERLEHIFGRQKVQRRAEFVGASSTSYEFTAAVKDGQSDLPTLFEPVSQHQSSVAHAAMKFNDVARLDRPPHLVAVVHAKDRWGSLLNILSQTADVINDNVPDMTYRKLASAA